ncbi:hypothetical protein [Spirosoma sordidisoli]|uniref:hypothetical protein n=1 Tax=Spirosoma sordidisoli TaxID=2502893 RepID=UPI001F1157D2|nr:hypothetical protein [Spirosoma sordidisoli]
MISWLAWFALLYQVYLQRTHNEKSVKPLGQIDLEDRQGYIYVRVTNNGLGPMIIDQLFFVKEGKTYTAIEDCLDLYPRSYTRISVNKSVRKVILPNSHLIIFETRLEKSGEDAHRVRQQLSSIGLQVAFRDIYDNKSTIKRELQWFSRYSLANAVER